MLREDSNIFVIAEIGLNHNGDVKIAKQLIDIAKDTGCDAVKFQKRTIERVYSKEVLDAPRESPWGTTQRHQKDGLEFGKHQYDILDAYARERKIEWFASAWDLDSQDFLRQYNLKYNKIASAMLSYVPLLEMVAEERRHTFVSTGMSTWSQIDRAVSIFSKYQCPFTLMHTVSNYPCEDDECNLLMLRSLRDRYGCQVGYSGHERGVLGPVLAVALGVSPVQSWSTAPFGLRGDGSVNDLAGWPA
jgi:N-acetylneuraminate synthase